MSAERDRPTAAATPEETSGTELMTKILGGVCLVKATQVAAKLGLADLLAEAPRTAGELAAATRVDPAMLGRLLRVLASFGVFAEGPDARWTLTPLAQPLRTEVAGSLRSWAMMYGEPWRWRLWEGLEHTVQTGAPAAEAVYGVPFFEHLRTHPDDAHSFNQAMTSLSHLEADAIARAYDFSTIGQVADIAGGHGFLIQTLLRDYPDLRGVLFDQPAVVSAARDRLAAAGLGARCECVGGDMFAAVPAGADAYVLKNILHDWTDDQSVTILERCRQARADQGRVLVVQCSVPPGNGPSVGKLWDLAMSLLGGRERTDAEMQAIFERAKLTLRRVVPTGSSLVIYEAS